MAAIPLASIKIRLAVAWLSSSGILGEYNTQAIALQGIMDSWHQKLLFLGGGGSRILLVTHPEDGPHEIFKMVSTVAADTRAPMPEMTLPHDGPGVVRLRPPTGGLLSITILPVHKRHRVDCSAYITACNPFSQILDDKANAERHAALGQELGRDLVEISDDALVEDGLLLLAAQGLHLGSCPELAGHAATLPAPYDSGGRLGEGDTRSSALMVTSGTVPDHVTTASPNDCRRLRLNA